MCLHGTTVLQAEQLRHDLPALALMVKGPNRCKEVFS